jgi:mono/diheme cytochrome c family protein
MPLKTSLGTLLSANITPDAQTGIGAWTPDQFYRVILAGVQRQASATATPAAMPAFGMKLSDEDAAVVATYVRNAWGNSAPPVSASEVAKLRRKVGKPVQKPSASV